MAKSWAALFYLIILLQGCQLLVMAVDSTGPPSPESPGIIQRTRDAYRSAVDRAKDLGELAWGFAELYYEDHLKGSMEPYWPTFDYSSAWSRVKARVPWRGSD
ncbi:apolipoprotein C-IV [Engraulis encrasicolus]|uniref:apolipoprotein C-IV n=1 Tax=Engraulis encrasicolus TaxID=184585 RepID=UPI002FD1739E